MKYKNIKKVLIATCALALAVTGSTVTVQAEPLWEINASDVGKTDLSIASEKDFLKFVSSVNAGDDYRGKTVRLTQDIEFDGYTSVSMSEPFAGTFDGDGHCLSGFPMRTELEGDCKQAYLFRENNGVIKNLKIDLLKANDGTKCYENDSGYIGFVYLNAGLVENCEVGSNVTMWASQCGGIVFVNQASGKIVNCCNRSSVKAYYNAGGIAVWNDGKIGNCINYGSVIADGGKAITYAGGISAFCEGGNILHCINLGNVKSGSAILRGTYDTAGSLVANDKEVLPTIKFCAAIQQKYLALTGFSYSNAGEFFSEEQFQSKEFAENWNKTIASHADEWIPWISTGYSYPTLAQKHKIQFNAIPNGSAIIDKEDAAAGQIVTITPKPDAYCQMEKVEVCNAYGDKVPLTQDNDDYQFTMPDSDVTIQMVFTKMPNENQLIQCRNRFVKACGYKTFALNPRASVSKFCYESSNKSVAVVSANGLVTVRNPGYATITITAVSDGHFNEAKKTVAVVVQPQKELVVQVKNVKGKKLHMVWRNDTKATGYEWQCSTDRNFKNVVKKSETSKNNCTITRLRLKQQYFVRARSYKKVVVNGKTQKIYGTWSTAKSSGKILK